MTKILLISSYFLIFLIPILCSDNDMAHGISYAELSKSENYAFAQGSYAQRLSSSYFLEQSYLEIMEFDQSFLKDEISPSQEKSYLFTLCQPADQTLKFGAFDALKISVHYVFPPDFLFNATLSIKMELLNSPTENMSKRDILKKGKHKIRKSTLINGEISFFSPSISSTVSSWFVPYFYRAFYK